MTSPQLLEILDLRHFTARQLRPLLEQEAEVWNQRLRWDFRPSTELLLQYLDSRILPGYVALVRGRICGFCFCVYEGQKAVVGDIYASRHESSPLAIIETLSRHLMATLEASPDVRRIEAQLLLFDQGVLPPLLSATLSREAQLNPFVRLFLELELMTSPVGSPRTLPAGIEPIRWAPSLYEPVAHLIQHAYSGHLDADINDQYRSLAGSQRFLHNIIRFPGCGTFDPESSFVLREQRTNIPIAVILCSRVAHDTAHITQLCIAPAWREKGLGAALLGITLRHLPNRGYRYLTLTVSEDNRPAVQLYQRAGFRTRHRFDAIVIKTRDIGPPLPLPFPSGR